MPKSYSIDLRERVLQYLEKKQKQERRKPRISSRNSHDISLARKKEKEM